MEFSAVTLGEDGRNNSAWSHRAAAAARRVAAGEVDASAAADAEFALAVSVLALDPDCESAWDHMRAAADVAGPGALASDARYAAAAAAALATRPGCVPALLLLHEAHAARAAAAAAARDAAAFAESSAAAAECRRRLAAADPGRAGLWRALGGERA